MVTVQVYGDHRRMSKVTFEWDVGKDDEKRHKHGISFGEAQYAFADPQRVIAKEVTHSTPDDPRFYCFGRVGDAILTVRFTWRRRIIRIFGAGYWRKGRRIYERENEV